MKIEPLNENIVKILFNFNQHYVKMAAITLYIDKYKNI